MRRYRWLRHLIACCAPLAVLAAVLGCHSDATGPSGGTVQGSYAITVRFIDSTPPSAAVSAAFTRAVAKWQSIILDSVGSIQLNNLPAGACDSTQPAINETVKDLLILVHIEQIADTVAGLTILGEGGPCVIRIPSNLPAFGVMSLNSASLQFLSDQGLLDVVIEHEIAHILGFGTIWDLDGFLQDSASATPWFSGSQAQAAFRTALPSFMGNVVPVEGTGQSGTVLAHWRESVMTNEMMTGLIDPSPDPLSRVTIASLGDLGYTVNMTPAEAWPTPAGSVTPTLATMALRLVRPEGGSLSHTILRRPRYAVNTAGTLTRLSLKP